MKSLKTLLKKYPNAYLHYDDTRSWTLYQRKPTIKEWEDGTFDKLTLVDGDDDHGWGDGAARFLAKALGIQVGCD